MKPLKEVTIKCVKCGNESKMKTALYMRMTVQERASFQCNYCARFSGKIDIAETAMR